MVISKELAAALDSLNEAFRDAEEYFKNNPCSEGMSIYVSDDEYYDYYLEIAEKGALTLTSQPNQHPDNYEPEAIPGPRSVSHLSIQRKKDCAVMLPKLIESVRKKAESYPSDIQSLADKIRNTL